MMLKKAKKFQSFNLPILHVWFSKKTKHFYLFLFSKNHENIYLPENFLFYQQMFYLLILLIFQLLFWQQKVMGYGW